MSKETGAAAPTARYHLIGSPRSRVMRVIWLLEELGLPYEIEPLSLGSDAVRARSPEGKVPILETPEGAQLTDSVAIMTYLADRHGDPDTGPSWPAGALERGRQDGHTQFLVDEMDGALWTLSLHRYVLPEEMRALDAVAPGALRLFHRAVERLAARIGDGPYLMGARFTLPDIVAGHCAGWAKVAGIEIQNDAVAAYLKRIYARDANARARTRAAEALTAAAAGDS